MKKIKIEQIQQGPILQRVLPSGFVDRVIKFKQILKEVETSSIEVAISNFQRDYNPERELIIWEAIAEHYQKMSFEHPDWTVEDKKKAFAELLQTSWGA